MEVVGKMQKVC